jgi:hypothetical protein
MTFWTHRAGREIFRHSACLCTDPTKHYFDSKFEIKTTLPSLRQSASAFAMRPSGFKKLLVENFT